MKTIILELDYMNGPIIKDYFSIEKGKLITNIQVIDDNAEINMLNDEISKLYSSFYDFDNDKACTFDVDQAKTYKDTLLNLINKLVGKLNQINDGSYIISNHIILNF